MTKYEVIIYWSDEDEAFMADAPELAGCAAHGSIQEEALAHAPEAMHLWIETANEFGGTVPELNVRRLLLQMGKASTSTLRRYLRLGYGASFLASMTSWPPNDAVMPLGTP